MFFLNVTLRNINAFDCYCFLVTARKRSFGQGNIFSRVCQEFCSQGGGGLPQLMLGYHPRPGTAQADTPPQADTPWNKLPPPPNRPSRANPTPPEQCMLGDTVNKRAVCVLLECNLVVIVLSWNLTEKRPPWLVKQPPREIIFLPKEDIRVPCRAEGQPLPQWV